MSTAAPVWPHPFKLGKVKSEKLMGAPAFGDFTEKVTAWPAVKPWGWEYKIEPDQLLMLGNDQISDCAEAAIAHFIQTSTASTDNPLIMTMDQVSTLYTASAGYDPNAQKDLNGNNPTDNGTALITMLNVILQNGVPCMDKTGKEVLYEIYGWATLDISSMALLRYACHMLGGLLLGHNLPQSAMLDTGNWLWDPKSPVIGGHATNMEGEGSKGVHVDSWGRSIPASWPFILNTLDEAYVIFGKPWVDAQGKSPSGFDLDGMLSAMKTFGSTNISA